MARDATQSSTAPLREGDEICDTSGEQYEPTTVNTVLGNPDVTLTEADESGDETPVKRAPTAADIAELGESFHLNLPADPLGDTCDYAKDFAKLKREGRAPAITYAHIAREKGRPGLAIQYWFFWYFNQFNDLHEGDWEGMQVVVYPAAGSHGTFYEPAVYIQNGRKGSGVGCDDTSSPLRRLVVHPIQVPTHPSPIGRFAWLTYEGRWGQWEKSFNNGPTGAQTKTRWLEPMAWMEEIRSTSPHLPAGSVLGPTITKSFCGAVAGVTSFLNHTQDSPWVLILVPIVVLLLIGLIAWRTRWRPLHLGDLRRQPCLRPVAARLGRPLLAPLARLRADRPERDPDHRRLRPGAQLLATLAARCSASR